jgi:hypothetical protein
VGAYDLSGRLTVGFDGDDRVVSRLLAAQMDPFRASAAPGRSADVSFVPDPHAVGTLVDVQNPARDGIVTVSDGDGLAIVADGLACRVPDRLADRPVRFAYQPGFPLARIYTRIVRPALQLALHPGGAAAVHAASVELDGRAVLVAGWSETGKTETALALMESGARFLSDKWTVVGTDGEASAFPVGVGVRGWVLPHLPTLAAALPRRARARLGVAGAAAAVTRPLRARPGRAGAAAERAVALADRAALTPTQLRMAYGQRDDAARRLPVGAVLVLTTVPGPEIACEPADPGWAAARLARSAAYERRELFAVQERRRYAFPRAGGESLDDVVLREAAILERALGHGAVLEVRAPFPVDPRRVAAAVSRRL